MAPRHGACVGAIPASRTNSIQYAARQPRRRVSKTQPAWGSTTAACQFGNFFWDRGRQAMHLPCKQTYVGALPTGSTISVIGETVISRSVEGTQARGSTEY